MYVCKLLTKEWNVNRKRNYLGRWQENKGKRGINPATSNRGGAPGVPGARCQPYDDGTYRAQAGVTRGAIYWHFNNKLDLFQAMREQVFLPLIDRMDDTLLVEGSEDPLTCIENFLCGTIQVLTDSVETREIYEIMMIKCEYVDEFATVLQQIFRIVPVSFKNCGWFTSARRFKSSCILPTIPPSWR